MKPRARHAPATSPSRCCCASRRVAPSPPARSTPPSPGPGRCRRARPGWPPRWSTARCAASLQLDAWLAPHCSRPLGQLDPAARVLLRMGAYQLLVLQTPPHAAVGETVELAKRVGARPRRRLRQRRAAGPAARRAAAGAAAAGRGPGRPRRRRRVAAALAGRGVGGVAGGRRGAGAGRGHERPGAAHRPLAARRRAAGRGPAPPGSRPAPAPARRTGSRWAAARWPTSPAPRPGCRSRCRTRGPRPPC